MSEESLASDADNAASNARAGIASGLATVVGLGMNDHSATDDGVR